MIKLIKSTFFVSALALNCTAMAGATDSADSLYLMSYFKSDQQHLFYSYSHDGKHWNEMNSGIPVFNAFDDAICIRDPYLRRVEANGKTTFHLVHTWGWDNPAIFHWESDDLIHWHATNGGTTTDDGKIMLMDGNDGRPESPCAWAPEFTYNEADGLFYIYWASRFDGYLRHYYCTTADWTEFSIPQVYLDPGFTTIDLTVMKYGDTYYGYYKDERDGQKTILCATSTSLDPAVDTFKGTAHILPEDFPQVEGPSVFPIIGGSGWIMYFDKFADGTGFSYARTDNPANGWTLIPDSETSNPDGVRHGSVEIISTEEFSRIFNEYESEKISVLPAADQQPTVWKYSSAVPGNRWLRPDFDDSHWKEGNGGFGSGDVPGSVINTTWDTADLYLRKNVDLADLTDKQLGALTVYMHHDDSAEVYINGVKALETTGYTSGYSLYGISDEARATLIKGENIIGVHCHQDWGGQYIDLGLKTVADTQSGLDSAVASFTGRLSYDRASDSLTNLPVGSELLIFDISGRLIQRITSAFGDITLSSLPRGCYIAACGRQNCRFIK